MAKRDDEFMRFCNRCNVTIENNVKNCPLCSRLTKEISPDYEQDFPDNISKKKFKNPIRIIMFIAIAVICINVAIDLVNPAYRLLSMLVIVSTVYATFVAVMLINSHRNIGLMVLVNTFGVSLFIIFIDYYLGFKMWSLNYVIPALIIAASAAITIIIVIKPMLLRDYIIYQLIIALMGICALLLVVFDVVTVQWPSISSCVYCVLLFIGMFLFRDRGTRHELKKRFHY